MFFYYPFSKSQRLKIKSELNKDKTLLYPTETIMAIGCCLDSREAVTKIREIKNRKADKAMLMLASNWSMIQNWVDPLAEDDLKILASLKSAPITIALPSSHLVKNWLNPGGNSLAFRITNNKCALELIKIVKRPLVSSSANISGQKFDEKFAMEKLAFKTDLAIIVNKDKLQSQISTNFKKPSTVLEYKPKNRLVLIRLGDYTLEQLRKDLPQNWQVIS